MILYKRIGAVVAIAAAVAIAGYALTTETTPTVAAIPEATIEIKTESLEMLLTELDLKRAEIARHE